MRRCLESAREEDLCESALALICSERMTLWRRLRQLHSSLVSQEQLISTLKEVCGDLNWEELLKESAPNLGSQVLFNDFLKGVSVRPRRKRDTKERQSNSIES